MKRIICCLLAAILMLNNVNVVYAQSSGDLLHTGGISVEQDIYQVDENGKRVAINHDEFLIGEEMSYVVDITNKLNACYIRIDAKILLDDKQLPNLYFTGVNTNWIVKDDYWYYTIPLQKKEMIQFCRGVKIPASLKGKKLDIITKVEAIQEYLFTPDFDADDPFQGIPIEDVQVDHEIDIPEDAHHAIEFDSSLGAIIDNKNFLSGIGEVMPGQTVSDTFTVTNGSKRILKLKMYSEDGNEVTPKLQNIGLTIKKDDEVVYNGLLYDEVFKEGLVLGTVDDGENATFMFEIDVPITLTSSQAMKASMVHWYFDGELLSKPVEPDPPETLPEETTPEETSPQETPEETKPVESRPEETLPEESSTDESRPTEAVKPSRPSESSSEQTKPTETTTKPTEQETTSRPSSSGGSSGGGGGSRGSSSSSNTAINGVMYESPDPSLKTGITGEWVHISEEKQQWKFRFSNGTYAKNGWLYIRNPYYNNLDEYSWYHFGDEFMEFGWIKGKGDIWYYGHEISDGDLGTLVKGWHHDKEDGRSYYLDLVTGIMKSGWTVIDGNWYYFAKTTDTFKQNWFWNTGIGRWVYDMLGNRPYGSMYVDEMTPDGYRVNEKGIWPAT